MDDRLSIAIVPYPEMTRVLVINGAGTTLLKATLPHSPRHPRAIATLCEALALWSGRPIRAALAVEKPGAFCATVGWLETLDHLTASPLFTVEYVDNPESPGEYDDRDGLGDFSAVRRLLPVAYLR